MKPAHRKPTILARALLALALLIPLASLPAPTLAALHAQGPTPASLDECSALNEQGYALLASASYREALSVFEKALSCMRAAKDRSGEAAVLANIGSAYQYLSQYDEALRYLTQALEIVRGLHQRADEAIILNNIGLNYDYLGRYPEALGHFEQSLAIRREVKDRQGEGTVLNNMGLAYDHMDRYTEAIDHYRQALEIRRKENDRTGEGATLNNLGVVLYRAGRRSEALVYLDQALAVRREAKDRLGEAVTLGCIGVVYRDNGAYEEALDWLEQALAIAERIGDRAGQARHLDNIGITYRRQGEYATALQHLRKSLDLRRAIRDQAGEATTLGNLGVVHADMGEYAQAMEYYEQALALDRALHRPSAEASVLANIALVRTNQGQYQQALANAQKALAMSRSLRLAGDPDGPAQAPFIERIGEIYYALGLAEQALPYYEQARDIAAQSGNKIGEARCLDKIGSIVHRLGKRAEAYESYSKALTIHHNTNAPLERATALGNLATILAEDSELELGVQALAEVQAIYRGLGYRLGEASALQNIGDVLLAQKDPEAALLRFQVALDIRTELGDQAGRANTLRGMGDAYRAQGRLDQALAAYRQAIDLQEGLRSAATLEEIRTSLADEGSRVYRQAITLLVQMDRPGEAFDLVERARARTLLDQLANVRISPFAGSDPALVERAEDLLGEIQAIERRIKAPGSSDPPASLRTSLEVKRTEYARLQQNLKLANPAYAAVREGACLTLAETQKVLADVTLVEYYVTPQRTFAFVVTHDSFQAVSLPVTEEELAASLDDLYRSFSVPGVPAALVGLHGQLFAPLVPYIQTAPVCIAPHGILHHLPFAALHDGKQYLVEQHTLSYTPSASALPLALVQRKESAAPLLVLGDPDGSLPQGRREAQAIATLYGATAYVGRQAREGLVWTQGPQAGILHLSAHGKYEAGNPLFSAVELSPDDTNDGRLEVHEIYSRGLSLAQADLVVLSACETGLGSRTAGDEVMGLNRAFLYAGAPSVLASLWSVGDESTEQLMTRFYAHLRQGEGKAQALRAAQLEMLADPAFAHPYHWAAFGITGDYGSSPSAVDLPKQAPTVAPPRPPSQGRGGLCGLPIFAFGVIAVASLTRRRRSHT